MKNFIMFLFIMIPFLIMAQTGMNGHIYDKTSKEALAYVNIGIIGKNKGTVSDISGFFSLSVSDSLMQDSLRFSMAGYKSRTFGVAQFIRNNPNPVKVFLEPDMVNLEEVEIQSTRLREKILGNKTESLAMRAGFSSNELGNEVGIPVKIKKRTYIKELRVFIAENKYDTLKFRINIYKLVGGMPGEKILNRSVVVHTTLSQGRLRVDLTKYNVVADSDIFVALEWIEDLGSNGLYFSASFSSNPILVRHTSQGNWVKTGPISLGISLKVLQ